MINWKFSYVNPIITLLCNNKCPYCITKNSEQHCPPELVSWMESCYNYERWIQGLENFPINTVKVFNGGEPTLFPGIEHIVNHFSKFSNVGLGTNLKSDTSLNIIKRMNPQNLTIAFSLHSLSLDKYNNIIDGTEPGKALERVNQLISNGYNMQYFIIDYPDTDTEKIEFHFRSAGIYDYKISNFLGYHNNKLYIMDGMPHEAFDNVCKNVKCQLFDPPIGPDGKIYACHYGLYTKKIDLVIGDIFSNQFIDDDYIECKYYGKCNPCDFTYDRRNRATLI